MPSFTRIDNDVVPEFGPGEGDSMLDPALLKPRGQGVTVNGAPVRERSHEFVLEKKPDAPNL